MPNLTQNFILTKYFYLFSDHEKELLNVDSGDYLLLLLLLLWWQHVTLVFLTTRKFKLFHFFQNHNFQICSAFWRRQSHRLISVNRTNIFQIFLKTFFCFNLFLILLFFFTQHWLENWSFWQLQLLGCWLLSECVWVCACACEYSREREREIRARISSLFNA